MTSSKKGIMRIAAAGGIVIAVILVFGILWVGQSARSDTEQAVRSVSLLYLDELAGRREQVVADNLQDNINVINIAISMMDSGDLSDIEHLKAYQSRMKALFRLEKFAFVDTEGTIYTSLGVQNNVDEYHFDHLTLTEPEISIKDVESLDKKVVIAVPAGDLSFNGKTLSVCFMEIDMDVMLSGVSMQSQSSDSTFCNIYTNNGIALSNTVLGGLAVEDNLLEAFSHAEFEPGYSLEKVTDDFAACRKGVVSFSYNGIRETLSYVPIEGTNWMLTYLIRESIISDQIGSVSDNIIRRSSIQFALSALVLVGLFMIIIRQSIRAERLQRADEQAQLITALSSDYWSVYYISLDRDRGVCYQSHSGVADGIKVGEEFDYMRSFTAYADKYITDEYRGKFMEFIQPDAIKTALADERVISYRYMVHRDGRDSYEMVRFAGVRHPEDRDDHLVHSVGACFVNVDAETRKSLEQSRVLSEALAAAEEANKAKTVFLSNMSHEIRTPMNAIIGLNNIAMHDPETPEKTKGYLEKMEDSANHLLSIINDILDMSRIESGRMVIKNEEFSFPKMLEQINTMISGQCRDKNQHYECRLGSKVDDYYIGDDIKLRQVLINILGNAVKFTPEGGTIEFSVEETARMAGNSTLQFVVKDNGIGMSKEYLPRLFETFTQEHEETTNRYGSTGLGMPITKNLVELMNGSIAVESEKGKGSTFTVCVPLGETKRRSIDTDELDVDAGDMNVLVIDDDPIACEHAEIVLGQIGISCERALSGPEAIEKVRLRTARSKPYNLILVDWKMPGMDGVETTRRIREIVGRDTAIIILTSYNWDEIIDEARKAGVDTFVPKPLFAATVMDEFREAFRSRKAASGKSSVDLNGCRILMAEDVEVNADIMTMVLSMRGITADHAENGRIAVEKFASNPEGYYDAVLMDMRMPEMDGLEATRRIRAMDRSDAKTVPIIALTANAFDEDVQRSMQAGLNAHLSKPVQPDDLFATLEKLLAANKADI